MQAPPDVLDWLRAIGFRKSIVAHIAAGQYDVPPTLAAMQASIAVMQELLHMSNAQVRPIAWCGVQIVDHAADIHGSMVWLLSRGYFAQPLHIVLADHLSRWERSAPARLFTRQNFPGCLWRVDRLPLYISLRRQLHTTVLCSRVLVFSVVSTM